MQKLSAPGLVVFMLSATFAFFDLIMSLEPHWFSTIYGAMFLVGQVLQTLCVRDRGHRAAFAAAAALRAC